MVSIPAFDLSAILGYLLWFLLGFLLYAAVAATVSRQEEVSGATAPILMPVRMSSGVASAWQVGLALVLTVIAILGLTWIAGASTAIRSCALERACGSAMRSGGRRVPDRRRAGGPE